MVERTVVLGVDVGGTKLAAGAVDREGRVLSAERMTTPQRANASTLWAALTGLVDRTLAAAGSPRVAGVGIGCGGPMTWPAGEVSPLNIPGWRRFPLRARFAERFPGRPVRLHNDAVCFAAAEHWRGAGQGTDSLLGIVVSTGVGGGLILDGRVFGGTSGHAGHIGHVVVDPTGPPCTCGGRGCLEAVARGPAVIAWARERGWASGAAGADEGLAGQRLVADATNGDPVAAAALARAGSAVGVAIASAVALLDLDSVIVGGGLAQAGDPLFLPLRQALAEHAGLEFVTSVQVHRTGLGERAGIVGAAALVLVGDLYWAHVGGGSPAGGSPGEGSPGEGSPDGAPVSG